MDYSICEGEKNRKILRTNVLCAILPHIHMRTDYLIFAILFLRAEIGIYNGCVILELGACGCAHTFTRL